MHSYSASPKLEADQREQLILEHLPQVRLIARRSRSAESEGTAGSWPGCMAAQFRSVLGTHPGTEPVANGPRLSCGGVGVRVPTGLLVTFATPC